MEQWEFNRLVIHGTEKELDKAMQEHPDLMDKCGVCRAGRSGIERVAGCDG